MILETVALFFSLALVLALFLSLRLRLPRVVVRVALVKPGFETDGPQPSTHGAAERAIARTELAVRDRQLAPPRACEVRLANNLHAWRDRRRRTQATSFGGGAHRLEIVP